MSADLAKWDGDVPWDTLRLYFLVIVSMYVLEGRLGRRNTDALMPIVDLLISVHAR
jgi:hypothetical protein